MTTRTDVEEEVDRLISMRWGMMYDGRCPSCERIIERADGDGATLLLHYPGCRVAMPHLEELAEQWGIPLGKTTEEHIVNGLKVTYTGPVRLDDDSA